MKYAVLVRSPSDAAGEGHPRLYGPWRDVRLAEEFCARVDERANKATAAATEKQDYDAVYHHARVLILRPHRLRGDGGAYDWAVGENA